LTRAFPSFRLALFLSALALALAGSIFFFGPKKESALLLSQEQYGAYFDAVAAQAEETVRVPVEVSVAGFSPPSFEVALEGSVKRVDLEFSNPEEVPHTLSRVFSSEELAEFEGAGLDPEFVRQDVKVGPGQKTVVPFVFLPKKNAVPEEIVFKCTQNCVQESVPAFTLRVMS